MDVISIVKELAAGGFATFLVAIIVAGKYRIWIWSYVYDEMIKEKDAQLERERAEKNEWKALVFQTKRLTERSVELADKALASK